MPVNCRFSDPHCVGSILSDRTCLCLMLTLHRRVSFMMCRCTPRHTGPIPQGLHDHHGAVWAAAWRQHFAAVMQYQQQRRGSGCWRAAAAAGSACSCAATVAAACVVHLQAGGQVVGGALHRARGHPVHECYGCTHHIAKHAPLASGTINIFRVCAAASLRAVARGRGLSLAGSTPCGRSVSRCKQ